MDRAWDAEFVPGMWVVSEVVLARPMAKAQHFRPGVLTHCIARRTGSTGYTAKFPNPEPIPQLDYTLHKNHRSVAQQTSVSPCMATTSKGWILLTDMTVRSSFSREQA